MPLKTQVQIHPGLDIQNVSSIIYQREIDLIIFDAGLRRFVLLLTFQSGLIVGEPGSTVCSQKSYSQKQ